MKNNRQSSTSSPSLTARDPSGHARPADHTTELGFYKSAEGRRLIMDWYDAVLEEITVPWSSLYAHTRFGRTHMIAAGPEDAEPLFLIPGIAGCAALWRRQIVSLSGDFRVYALDIPGQPGRSDPRPPSFLNDDCCDWLVDVLDDLGIDRAHFAGVSVGGWIAMRMGIVAPGRVRKVVMLGSTGIMRARLPVRVWLSRVMTGLRSTDVLESELSAKRVSSTVTRSPGKSFGTFDRQLAKAMALCTRHYRVDRSLGIYDERTRRIRLGRGLRVLKRFFLAEPAAELRRFAVPGLVVYGRHEVLYDPDTICARARRLMGGPVETCVVEDAGHAAIYDRPGHVDGLIRAFLQKPAA